MADADRAVEAGLRAVADYLRSEAAFIEDTLALHPEEAERFAEHILSLAPSRPAAPELRAALGVAQATIEAMSGDAADLHDLIGEAAAMRTVLRHLLGDDRGRIHDSGCGTCDAGRALLTADHELPSFAASSTEDTPKNDQTTSRFGATEDTRLRDG